MKNKEGYILKYHSKYLLFVGNQMISLSEQGFQLVQSVNIFPVIDLADLKDRLNLP